MGTIGGRAAKRRNGGKDGCVRARGANGYACVRVHVTAGTFVRVYASGGVQVCVRCDVKSSEQRENHSE